MSSRTEPAALRFHLAPAPRQNETTIFVRDLEVHADIGVNADEIGRRQPLLIHAELRLWEPDADEIGATFDYRDVVRHAEALAAERIALIETFARRLADTCLEHPAILRAEIRIEKPAALSNGIAGVCVVRERRHSQ